MSHDPDELPEPSAEELMALEQQLQPAFDRAADHPSDAALLRMLNVAEAAPEAELQALFESTAEAPPAAFETRMTAKIADIPQSVQSRNWLSWKFWVPSIGLAGAAAAAAAVALWWATPSPTAPTQLALSTPTATQSHAPLQPIAEPAPSPVDAVEPDNDDDDDALFAAFDDSEAESDDGGGDDLGMSAAFMPGDDPPADAELIVDALNSLLEED